jgi:predicted DNA binding CopG/RHH family protein
MHLAEDDMTKDDMTKDDQTKRSFDPTPSLDNEEQWYEDQADQFVDTKSHLRESLVAAARNSARKTERMSIRMTKSDMGALQARAAREGLPYQSLNRNRRNGCTSPAGQLLIRGLVCANKYYYSSI